MSINIYNRYYVYAYLRSNGTPYYIGKGCKRRAYVKHGHFSVPKDKSKIVFLETNLSNVGACALERRYIRWYGRKDLGTGILRNMTDGGDGGENRAFSIESKMKISNAIKGRKHTLEARSKMSAAKKGKDLPKMKGKPKSLEHRAKMSAASKGKPKSPEHRAKMSAAHKGKNNHFYGKKHTLEARYKMSAAKKHLYIKHDLSQNSSIDEIKFVNLDAMK